MSRRWRVFAVRGSALPLARCSVQRVFALPTLDIGQASLEREDSTFEGPRRSHADHLSLTGLGSMARSLPRPKGCIGEAESGARLTSEAEAAQGRTVRPTFWNSLRSEYPVLAIARRSAPNRFTVPLGS